MKPARTLREVLAGHVARQPDRPFLIAPETGRVLTYGEIDRQARLLVSYLALCGLKKGSKVALYLPNGYQAMLLFLASMIGGFVIAPLNLLAQRSQLAYVLEHCDCEVLFTTKDHEPALAAALADVKRKFEIVVIDADATELFLADRLPPVKWSDVSPKDPALLMYTSGTTGQPKGALLTHANLIAGARAVAGWHGLGPTDRVLSSLPIYHINGQVIATTTTFVSGGSLIAPKKFHVSEWWKMVEKHEATWINMVPTIIAYLLNAAEPGKTYRFPKVRFGRSASARGVAAPPGGAGGRRRGRARRELRAGHPRLHRGQGGAVADRRRAARLLRDRARPLQDAARVPVRGRASEGPFWQDTAPETGRTGLRTPA